MSAKDRKLLVSHINVRQSVAFLLIRLFLVEVGFGIVIFFVAFPPGFVSAFFNTIPDSYTLKITIFISFVMAKIYLLFLIVYQWLNEYYEITPTRVIKKKGFIFRTEEAYAYNYIRLVGVQQDFFGKLLNYGSIHLYDRYLNKDVFIYLIHNPIKHFNLIRELTPFTDEEKDVVGIYPVEV